MRSESDDLIHLSVADVQELSRMTRTYHERDKLALLLSGMLEDERHCDDCVRLTSRDLLHAKPPGADLN